MLTTVIQTEARLCGFRGDVKEVARGIVPGIYGLRNLSKADFKARLKALLRQQRFIFPGDPIEVRLPTGDYMYTYASCRILSNPRKDTGIPSSRPLLKSSFSEADLTLSVYTQIISPFGTMIKSLIILFLNPS